MKRSIDRTWKCTCISFRKGNNSPKTALLTAVTVLLESLQIVDLNRYEELYDRNCTVWVMPYLFSPLMLMAISLIIAALFSNAPFYDPYSVFVVSKVGRGPWFVGSVLYIFLESALFSALVCAVPFLVGIPFLDYSPDLHSAYFSSIGRMSLPLAELTAFCMIWLVGFWLGMLILALNVTVKHTSGILVSTLLCFFSYMINIYPPFREIRYFTPVNWIDIGSLNWTARITNRPHIGYAVLFILISSLVMTGISWLAVRRCDLRVPK